MLFLALPGRIYLFLKLHQVDRTWKTSAKKEQGTAGNDIRTPDNTLNQGPKPTAVP